MDDLSTFIWIGIGILWLLTRLIRGGARKAARQAGSQRAVRSVPPPARRAAAEGSEATPNQPYSGGQSAKPIEPR